MSMKPHERNQAVDGLKGIAILIVILHHFVLAFYPSIITNTTRLLHTKASIELFIYKTPISIFFAGSFAVALFYLITGYVLSKQTIAHITDKSYVERAAYFRIFRLMPLIAIVLMFGFIVMNMGLTFNIPVSYYADSTWFASFFPLGKVSLQTIVRELFTTIPFFTSAKYYNVLWIIPYILFGSWLVYGVSYFFHESKYKFSMFIILLLAFYKTPYIAFIMGWMLAENEDRIRAPQLVYYIFLLLALIFGSSTFSALKVQGLGQYANLIKVTSAALFFLSFTRINWLKNMAQLPIFTYFGTNSYYYYLTHMLSLIMLPSYVFLELIPYVRYHQAVLTTLALYLVMTVVYSEALKRVEGRVFLKR